MHWRRYAPYERMWYLHDGGSEAQAERTAVALMLADTSHAARRMK